MKSDYSDLVNTTEKEIILESINSLKATDEQILEMVKLSKEERNLCIDYMEKGIELPVYLRAAINNSKTFVGMAEGLASYNTMRGGVEGFKGFVFEELHAGKATLGGTPTSVIANNGAADFLITNADGTFSYGQAKVGYQNTSVDWSKYKNQKIIIDNGNQQLIDSAKNAGMDVIESNVSSADAQSLAKKMQLESKLTGNTNAPITAHVKSIHSAGVESAKTGAAFGAGMSIGSNLVDLVNGEKEIGEATVAIAKDTVIAAGTSYVVGAATTAIASTTVGAAAIAAAPVVLAGAAVGVGIKIFKNIFWD